MTTAEVDKGQVAKAGQQIQPAFDLGWVSRIVGHSERRQVVVLAIGTVALATGDVESAAAGIVARHELVTSVVARLGGEVVRVKRDFHLVAWGHKHAHEDEIHLAMAAAVELAAGNARCGLDADIAATIEPAFQVPGLSFITPALDGALEQASRAQTGEIIASVPFCALLDGGVCRYEAAGEPASRRLVLRSTRARLAQLSRGKLRARARSELQLLQQLWSTAQVGQTCCVMLTSETGGGKSALVDDLSRSVLDQQGQLFLSECRPETTMRALAPLHELAARIEERPERDAATDEALAALGAELDTHLEIAQLDDAQAERVAGRLARVLAACCAEHPVAIVIEDLHWADQSTLRCLRALADATGSQEKLLVVATARVGRLREEALEQNVRWHRMRLESLDAGEIEQLLLADPALATLSYDAVARISEHAEGNPGIAVALARLSIESGGAHAHYRLLSQPTSLNALLTSRLDALGLLKPVAQAAALLGRVFDSRCLARFLQMELHSVESRLDLLVSRGVLVRRSKSPHSFRFPQGLVWSQAYGAVPRLRRRELHREIARIVEGDGGVETAVPPEVVAFHWKQAGDHARAFAWWSKAARYEADRDRPEAAVACINEALAAKQQAPQACGEQEEAGLMSLLGAQLRASQGSSSLATIAAYERAREIVAAIPARPRDIDLDISWGLATVHLVRGEIHSAVAASGRLLDDARECGAAGMVLVALRMHGTARLMSGDLRGALADFQAAVDGAGQVHDGETCRRLLSDPGAVALAHLASAQALAGHCEASRRSRAGALGQVARIGHAHTTSNVLGVLALAAMHLDDCHAAAALSRASLAVSAEHGHRYWETRARLILAFEETIVSGKPCPEPLAAELDRYRKSGAGRARTFSTCLAADVALRARRPQMALELLEAATPLAVAQGERLYLPEVIRLEACAKLGLGLLDATEVNALLREAETLAWSFGAIAFARRAAFARDRLEQGCTSVAELLRRAPSPAAPQTP